MKKANKFPEPKSISFEDEYEVIAAHIYQLYDKSAINILEAGCGIRWPIDIKDIPYELTGTDINEKALELRLHETKDLDSAILGDLRFLQFNSCKFDVIYNSNVLEHIKGAEDVLKNFITWLKPGGVIILRIPDRNSVKSFIARITPFWFHVFYKRYLHGLKYAGKPGHGPFPTVFDYVVSREGIKDFCDRNQMILQNEYRVVLSFKHCNRLAKVEKIIGSLIHYLSLKKFKIVNNYLFIIKKPESSQR